MNVISDPRVQLGFGLLVVTALFVLLTQRVLRRRAQELHHTAPTEERHLLAELVRTAVAPLSLFLWVCALQVTLHLAALGDDLPESWQWIEPALGNVAKVGSFVAFLWFFYRATRVVDVRLQRISTRTVGRFDDVLFPVLGTALRVTVPILALFLLIRLWPVSDDGLVAVRKLLGISLIAALTWTLRRVIVSIDAAVLGSKGLTGKTTVEQRALFTRVRMLRRIATVLLMTFALAAVLMMFEEVRDVGRSILASAGVAGIVIGFAAQRTLGNLFAGIQIALTQPVRLGDQVIVEGDFAVIEEITFTYVVARTWDERRIVLPIGYFIEKPFQNWTRTATSMLSALVLRVDFSLPVGELRDFLQEEIRKSKFWDQNVFGVQVIDSDDRSMQVRVLASAPDAGASWDLRCELREKAIDFIRRRYPQCLPKLRTEQRQIDAWRMSTALTDGDAPPVRSRPPASVPATRDGGAA